MSTTNVRVRLANGSEIEVEAVPSKTMGNVAFTTPKDILKFDTISSALEGISKEVVDAMRAVKPKSAKIEFGIKVGFEPGKLTALLVQASGEANLTVTLEWSDGSGG